MNHPVGCVVLARVICESRRLDSGWRWIALRSGRWRTSTKGIQLADDTRRRALEAGVLVRPA
jgi:hypothetical protein